MSPRTNGGNGRFAGDTLRALVKEGVIGSLAERAYTFMGGIYSARRVEQGLAPALRDASA